jgi:phage-related protein (TIGR01555 family)
MPARDAIRKGYDLTVNDGTEIDAKVNDNIRRTDKKFKLKNVMEEYITMGRVYGIRIAMFDVQSNDKDYYTKPFNIDGITPGSYKGIIQIDPTWIWPELTGQDAMDPASRHFYEPEFWNVAGVRVQRIHRSHLIIMRTSHQPDVLKPTYLYGGVPITQKIYERVYCAERTANEAPQLALSKRTTVYGLDAEAVVMNPKSFAQRMLAWTHYRTNDGVKIYDKDSEEINQFDTSLADLDAVIMTQYQLVAAAANVPVTKLFGTTPKGFNSTGNYEEASYHEEQESIQEHELTPLLDRHYMILLRSEFPEVKASFDITWKPLDSMTAKEQAEVNKIKAETGSTLINSGALDPQGELDRIVNDPNSDYSGLTLTLPEPVEVIDPNETENEEKLEE